MEANDLSRALGVLAAVGIDLDPIELRDVLWLAGRLPSERQPIRGGAPRPIGGPEPDRDRVSQDGVRAGTTLSQGSAPDASTTRRPADGHPLTGMRLHTSARGSGTGGSQAVRVPEPKELVEERLLARSLRPLKQHRPSPDRSHIDEAATADAVARSGLPEIVLRPEREPWLRCVVLVDDGTSMLLWRQQVAELAALLQRCGAFRQIHLHGLRSRRDTPVAVRPRPFSDTGARHSPHSVADPTGRTLVLVVSDGAGRAWRDGRMRAVLNSWGRCGPVAVVHTLPRRMWAGSGLATAPQLVCSDRRGAPNASWKSVDPMLPWPEASDRSAGKAPVPVPVLELSPAPLYDWASFLASPRGEAVLPIWEPMAPQPRQTRRPGDIRSTLSRFVNAASPEAHRLAAHLAAMAPVSVPVMRLVQSCIGMASGSGTLPLAEVFLGGLLKPAPGPGSEGTLLPAHQRLFDFPDQIKELLFEAYPAASLLEVSRLVSGRLTALAGTSPDFPAWLADGRHGGPTPSGVHFATASAALLKYLGVTTPATAASALSAANRQQVDPPTREPRRLLLMFAVADYEHQLLPDLPAVVQARHELVELFTERLGYEHVFGFPEEFSGSELIDMFRRATAGLDEQDLVTIYLAGHSSVLKDGTHVLLTQGSDPTNPASALPVRDVARVVLEGAGSRPVLLILDTENARIGGLQIAESAAAQIQRTLPESGVPAPNGTGLIIMSAVGPEGSVTAGLLASRLRSAIEDISATRSAQATLDLQAVADRINEGYDGRGVELTSMLLGDTAPPFLPNPRHPRPNTTETAPTRAGSQDLRYEAVRLTAALKGHTSAVRALACTVIDGQPALVSGGYDGTARVWDLWDSLDIASDVIEITNDIQSLACATLDGTSIAVISAGEGSLLCWNLATREFLGRSTAQKSKITAIACTTTDGRPVAVTGASDGTIGLWDLTYGRLSAPRKIHRHNARITGVDCTVSNGRPVAVTGAIDGSLLLLDLATGRVNKRLQSDTAERLTAIACTTLDGRSTVVVAVTGRLQLWDVVSGKCIANIPTGRHVTAIACTTLDGRPVAITGSHDGTVAIWDLVRGRSIGSPGTGHTGPVHAVACTTLDDRPVAITGADDAAVRVWDLL